MKISEISDVHIQPEDLLGPPKIDGIGFLLISFLSLVGGIIGGIIVLVLGYFTFGQFSLQAGVSPILLGMVSFFALITMNYFYLWGLSSIFPNYYGSSRTLYIQVTLYTVILYILIACVYFFIAGISFGPTGILVVFSGHVLLNCFGVVLITGILSQYRYSLLVFYSSIIAFILAALFLYSIFSTYSDSLAAIFLLTGLIALTFFLFTTITFGVYTLYYKIYTLTGSDPLGNIFGQIQDEESDTQKRAEQDLFKK